MNLNPYQTMAIRSESDWNIVLAGPGSGKTAVQIERAKYLVSRGYAPASFAFVTFTAAAARVSRRRLEEEVGKVGFVGTLHSMMLGALRRDDARWTMVSEEDAAEFIERFKKLLAYKGSAEELDSLRKESVLGASSAARVIRSYRLFMRDEHLLDYDMVLIEGMKMIEAGKFSGAWSAFFVDEFQDSAPVDAKIYLAINPEQLMVTADPDQSIYSFRGARPQNLADYWGDARFKHHVLDLNYRCPSSVCDVANAVVAPINYRVEKETVSASDFEGVISFRSFVTDTVERQSVRITCAREIESGTAPEEIAVLCRTNKLADEIRAELKAEGVPVAEVETDKKPRDWKLLLLIISMIGAPTSWALARLLTREQAKILKTDVEAAESALEAHRKDAPLDIPADRWAFPPLSVVLALNANFTRYGVSKASHALLSERVRLYAPESVESLLEALRASPEAVAKHGVNVLTVHAAKGEEFNVVLLPGADLFKGDDMDEERRLFFVACTRAKRKLAITLASRRSFTLSNGMRMEQNRDAGAIWCDAVMASPILCAR